ncbi:MAG TPA: M15 family metallopeptidase [Patescibacteria group bacterium]|nr:M15 family metallopeptidase [Patescibacteria group bacterium]
MKKKHIYSLLEEKMLSYADYVDMPVQASAEPLLPIPIDGFIAARQVDTAMIDYTGESIYLRRGVLERLQCAARMLADYDSTLQLEVVYGYRALSIQTRLFQDTIAKLQSRYTGEALRAAAHRFVAVPEAAGHPAGAAIDVQLIRNGQPLNFGTAMHEFTADTMTFSPFIDTDAWGNRQLLRQQLLAAGFAPFDGEWWHFSYGDKEWARYYNRGFAHYEQIEFSTT